MVSSSKIENLAQRFTPYIDELRDFFSSRKVPFGTIADLQAFPRLLRDPGFHEEMVSMVRSILYRESEAVPRTELMDLIALAVGGPQIEEAAPELHEPLRQILVFVTEVARSQRVTFPPELPPDTEPSGTRAAEPETPAAPLNLVFTQTPELHASGTPDPPAHLVNDRLSRALMDSQATVEPGPAVEPRAALPDPPPFTTERPQPTAKLRRSPRSLSSFLRNAYWIPGVCVLLLALAAAYSLKSRSHTQIATVPQQTSSPASAATPKPEAHGPALGASGIRGQHLAPQGIGAAVETSNALADLPGHRSSTGSRPSSRVLPDRDLPVPPTHNGVRPALTSSSIFPRVLGGREGVFLASSGMMAAHLLTAPAPHYPKLASLTHVEGEVIVQVVVGRNGGVEATRVLEGPRLLRGAAEHAIRHWRYRPYLIDGRPTDVATIVTVNFRLSR